MSEKVLGFKEKDASFHKNWFRTSEKNKAELKGEFHILEDELVPVVGLAELKESWREMQLEPKSEWHKGYNEGMCRLIERVEKQAKGGKRND